MGTQSTGLQQFFVFSVVCRVPMFAEGVKTTLQRFGAVEILENIESGEAKVLYFFDKVSFTTTPTEGLSIVCGSFREKEISPLVNSGVKGILETHVDPEKLKECLEVVFSGHTYIDPIFFDDQPNSSESIYRVLTPREKEVYYLVVQGLTNKRIGENLGIKLGTVKIHLKNILRKKGADSRYKLILGNLQRLR